MKIFDDWGVLHPPTRTITGLMIFQQN